MAFVKRKSPEVNAKTVKYWDITPKDAYVRVFDEMLAELDTSLFDTELVNNYQNLSLEARYLVTRFYIRAWRWVRKSELKNYMQPEKLTSALEELVKSEWLVNTPSFSDIVEVATIKELQQVADHFNATNKKTGLSKSELVDALKLFVSQRNFFTTSMKSLVTTKLLSVISDCYQINGAKAHAFFGKLEVMFLCPAYAALDSILRANMKVVNFLEYDYATQKEFPIFSSQQEFDQYYEARRLCDPLEELQSLSSDNFLNDVAFLHATTPVIAGPFSASYVYGRAIWLLSQLLMKAHRFQLEYEWIQKYLDQTCHRSKRGPAQIRKILLEVRFHQETRTSKQTVWLNKALNSYYDALAETNEIDALDLERKAVKLHRELRNVGVRDPPIQIKHSAVDGGDYGFPVTEIQGILRDTSNLRSTKTQWGGDGEKSSSVEETALSHYGRTNWHGGHYESGLVATIYWLCIWDIVFSDRTKFRCRFHTVPMNLQSILDSHKSELIDRFSPTGILDRLKKSYGELSARTPSIAGVNWSIPLEDLVAVAKGLGSNLTPIMTRRTENIRMYGSGFPDLTLWRKQADKYEVKFVEVKSENDTISDNQRLWIEFLLKQGIDVEICRVLHANSKSKRKRRKA